MSCCRIILCEAKREMLVVADETRFKSPEVWVSELRKPERD